MKKFLVILALVVIPFIFASSTNATIIDGASYSNGRISVQGEGEGEVQIVVFNLDKEPVFFTTVTAKDGKFSMTLPVIEGLEAGKYIVQSADYDGKNESSKIVTVFSESDLPSVGEIVAQTPAQGGLSLSSRTTVASNTDSGRPITEEVTEKEDDAQNVSEQDDNDTAPIESSDAESTEDAENNNLNVFFPLLIVIALLLLFFIINKIAGKSEKRAKGKK